jgi:hypothetical protein
MLSQKVQPDTVCQFTSSSESSAKLSSSDSTGITPILAHRLLLLPFELPSIAPTISLLMAVRLMLMMMTMVTGATD